MKRRRLFIYTPVELALFASFDFHFVTFASFPNHLFSTGKLITLDQILVEYLLLGSHNDKITDFVIKEQS